MILRKDEMPRSSFLSVEKDLSLITEKFLKNNRLKKLLHYTTSDALGKPSLSPEESAELFGKNIKIVPKLYVDGSVLNYIIINFGNFSPNATNSEFRDHVIFFDIVCHFDQWHLKDFQLRPYKIAAEIDSMINGKHLTGIGLTKFIGADPITLNDEFAGITLMYQVINGDEDKAKFLNPEDEAQFLVDNLNV